MTQKKANCPKTIHREGGATIDGAEAILDYLQRQNRPYSANEISANLHTGVTKAYAARALRDLWHNKQIEGQTAGKQVVYHALQEASNKITSETLVTLDEYLEKAQGRLSSLQIQKKKVRMELAALDAKPLLSELRRDVDQLGRDQATARTFWLTMKGNASMPVPGHMIRAGAEEDWRRWERHASSRARICRDLWRRCLDALPGDTAWEELWGWKGPRYADQMITRAREGGQ
ncbi:TBPIP-domain-containing protein [Aspergillus indologenus CBS 114.80]|uniref:TBPIP-domain-containing protein n=1 Tax=Aspergillus indologenus CBS 114.80 TaxID=1450541 RepID=A0A2V5HTI2_9EURO|nr:TBPIP-domain-containing protein [Aspergillus indologenus CBS 114.80]